MSRIVYVNGEYVPEEEARISVRNSRRELIKDIREFEEEKMISEDDLKRGEEDAQKLTDNYIEKINETN